VVIIVIGGINRGIMIFLMAGFFLMAQLSFVMFYAIPIADGSPRIIIGDPQEALSSGDYWYRGAPQTFLSSGDYWYPGAPQTPLSSDDRWWAGVQRWGAPHEPMYKESMRTTLLTPTELPGSDDKYYLLLSAWVDSPGCSTYVQMGISTIYYPDDPSQLWGLATSYTKDGLYSWNPNLGWIDDWEYVYEPHEMTLERGEYYTFEMVIDDGNLTFNMYLGQYLQFTKTVETGGNWLMTAAWVYPSWRYWPWVPCVGYTLYEEILPDGVTPSFDFMFYNIYADENRWIYWNQFYSGDVPSEVEVYLPSPVYWVAILNL
jgi:hypothetical protein